jgi:hypothetical protein
MLRNLFLSGSFLALMAFTPFSGQSTLKIENSAVSRQVSTTEVSWKQTTIDMGKVPQGTPATANFEFTNTGKLPLTISNVRTSCGCTVSDYPRDPIAPGKKGKVTATYNAANAGSYVKEISVAANIASTVTLTIKGEVIPK